MTGGAQPIDPQTHTHLSVLPKGSTEDTTKDWWSIS